MPSSYEIEQLLRQWLAILGNALIAQILQSTTNDSNIGSAQGTSSSASQLVSTLVPVIVVAVIWLLIFIILRPKATWKYAPRTQSRALRPK